MAIQYKEKTNHIDSQATQRHVITANINATSPCLTLIYNIKENHDVYRRVIHGQSRTRIPNYILKGIITGEIT